MLHGGMAGRPREGAATGVPAASRGRVELTRRARAPWRSTAIEEDTPGMDVLRSGLLNQSTVAVSFVDPHVMCDLDYDHYRARSTPTGGVLRLDSIS